MDNILDVETLWAMSGARLASYRAELERLCAIDPNARMEIRKAKEAGIPVDAINGTAEIRVMGPLSKRMSLMSYFFGGASYLGVKAALNAALADKSIERIMLHIESPGGSVTGMKDAAQAISQAKATKPITAYIDDLGASAAYYLATHASEIYASDMAEVGSIGVYALLYDDSEAFEKQGVKVIEATTSEMKLIGAPGVPITDAMKAEVQKHIDEWGNEFRSAVQRGRGLTAEQTDRVANGKLFIAKEALNLGLIDGISSLEEIRAIMNDRTALSGRARTARAKVSAMRFDATRRGTYNSKRDTL